jgi:hypothetical protein
LKIIDGERIKLLQEGKITHTPDIAAPIPAPKVNKEQIYKVASQPAAHQMSRLALLGLQLAQQSSEAKLNTPLNLAISVNSKPSVEPKNDKLASETPAIRVR